MCKAFEPLWPKLKRLGIDYNAQTGTDRITFHFGGLDENLDLVAQEIYEYLVHRPFTWTQEVFETEKLTILQEYEDAFNEQESGALHNLIRRHYNYFCPVGFREDIEAFSYEDALAARELFMCPNLICRVGNESFKPEVIKEPYQRAYEAKFGYYDAPQETVPKEGKTIVGLISRHSVPSQDRNKVGMILSCLNDGLEAPLAQEIREKRGLSYCSAGYLLPLLGTNVLVFFAATSKKQRKTLRKVYQEFFSGDLERHVSPSRFEDCYQATQNIKKTCDRLPHDGARTTILEDSPFEGLENFGYAEALEVLNRYFKVEYFEEVEY